MIALAAPLFLGFLVTLVSIPFARKYLMLSGVYSVDQHKEGKPKLTPAGGIAVLFGFVVAVTSYLGMAALFGTADPDTALVLAALNSAVIIALIGFIDDIHVNLEAVIAEELRVEKDDFELELHQKISEVEVPHQRFWDSITSKFGGNRESDEVIRNGLGQFSKMLFVLPAALPLIAVGAGSWTMHFPVLGTVNWGLLYPLVLLPVGLLFVSNVVNMLAGLNGLAGSMGLVASTSLGIYSYLNGSVEASLIAFSLSACLLAMLKYNFYPASILVGDSLTYLVGAGMFSAMVIGNVEKFAVFIFIPWFVEFFLKLRSGFQAHSWGELQDDGTIKPLHDKNYSLTHPLMRRGLGERQIVVSLAGIETLICLIGFILFTGII